MYEAAGVNPDEAENKARVALARKLSVILHSMWRSGEPFRLVEARPGGRRLLVN